MSFDMPQSTPFDSYGETDAGQVRNSAQTANLFTKLHRCLRGRYWIIVPLSLLCGVIGAYYGWKIPKPLWTSDGKFQIVFYIPSPLLAADPGGEEIRQYDQTMMTQVAVMTSRTMIDKALNSPIWEKTNRGNGPAAYKNFVSNLVVDHPRGTELITVSFTDVDSGIAAAGTQALILAYEMDYQDRQNKRMAATLIDLNNRASLLAKNITLDREKINEIAQMVAGSSDFEIFYRLKVEEFVTLQQKLAAARQAVALSEKDPEGKEMLDQLTPEDIAVGDEKMKVKLARQAEVQAELSHLRYNGVLEQNPKIVAANNELKDIEQGIIEETKAFCDNLRKASASPEGPNKGPVNIGYQFLLQSHEKLVSNEQTLLYQLEKAQSEMKDLGYKQDQVRRFQDDEKQNKMELAELRDGISKYEITNNGPGRLNVISYFDIAGTPSKDHRKIIACVAGMGGLTFPVAWVLAMSLMVRRYRFSDEAEGAGQPLLLGILPTLPDNLADPEQAAVAAHCIHQIRIMLQLGVPGNAQSHEPQRVFMITSSNTGDGKTSLTMALALSFAASGSRTLVIDSDMVGRGLTHRLRANKSPGLHECLLHGTIQGRVKKTSTANLYVLPIGGSDAAHAGSLSPASIRRLLVEAKKIFDIVVIDTGPILGSLEAAVVGAAADAVVLTVSRGQNQPMVQRAVKQLHSIGANIAGLVFNRAEKRDFNRSVGSSSIRSTSVQPVAPRILVSAGDDSSRFGPLARSVASFMPGMGNSSRGGNGKDVAKNIASPLEETSKIAAHNPAANDS